MKQGILTKADLRLFIDLLKKDHKFFTPVRRKDGFVFAEVTRADAVAFDYVNTVLSPKNLFLPQSEVICTFAEDSLCDVPIVKDKQVVFGMRPCDAAALSHLDRVFAQGDLKDPYYCARRGNAVIITLACSQPHDTCFCMSLEGSPVSQEGSDVMVYAAADRLFFEAVTDKGEKLMTAAQLLFNKPTRADLKARKQYETDAQKAASELTIAGVKERLQKCFDSPLWSGITERCLGCGVCTYVCPTCHCFDITDETHGQNGKRIRTWDSCQYTLFTHHASGHNPRQSKRERMRQRIMHKFLYTQENFGKTFCVGCGRCIRNCPVNMDIKETITFLASETSTGV